LLATHIEGVDTIAKAWRRTVGRIPDNHFLGTRDAATEGKPYKWRTFAEVGKEVDILAKALNACELIPEVVGEGGEKFRFMGIYAKNREEWATLAIACSLNSVVIIPFYDTLGPDTVEFVCNQTELTSVSCAGSCLDKLLKLRSEGKATSLLNIVAFDQATPD
jgi:long-chain acyl-CoA synthetase